MRTKTFKKSYCPDSIEYKGATLKLNAEASALGTLEGNKRRRLAELIASGKIACLVEVSNPRLRGKVDLYGQPYKNTFFIYSN